MKERKDFDYNSEHGYHQCHDCGLTMSTSNYQGRSKSVSGMAQVVKCGCGSTKLGFYRRSERDIRIINFAKSVLAMMEESKDWDGADMLDDFSSEAVRFGLATAGLTGDSYFRRAPDAIE